jgi:protein involved in polysaccharide export with SLBB domain
MPRWAVPLVLGAGLALTLVASPAGAQQSLQTEATSAQGGPIRLRPATTATTATPADRTGTAALEVRRGLAILPEPPAPDEFESYVTRQARLSAALPLDVTADTKPLVIRRLGSDLVTSTYLDDGDDTLPQVTPDYIVSTGDELQVLLWGSVDADLRVTVDRTGRIAIPRVGAVMVAGVRYADLQEVIGKRVSQVFKNYQLTVSLGRLRNVRVFITGYAKRPGTYSVSALSTLVAAVMRAGGPAAAGSFRNIQLRRAGSAPVNIDLYDLMLRGDKSTDRVLQADDTVYIGPVGPQVGLIGSVNKAAVFETRPGETLADVLVMAGGFSAIADTSRLAIERLDDRQGHRITQLDWPAAGTQAPRNGDVLRAFSAVEAVLPLSRQNKRIKIEGEVQRPGEYLVPADTRISTVMTLAGGLTPNAFLFGTEFSRENVRVTQQANYDRALRDLETEFAKATSTQRAIDSQEAATQAAQAAGSSRLIERLKAVKPTGRIVFQLPPSATELPDLPLEDGDRLYIPPRPTTVGVFGSVFSAGSYLTTAGSNVGDFLNLAGGPTRGADKGSTFVLRANGSVVSAPQRAGFLGLNLDTSLSAEPSLPGDTVFVPEEINKTTWTQNLKEWTQIFYQFGLGAAAIRTLQ